MTLSFRQAFHAKKSGAISWDEYIHNLLAHCGGVKHEEDNAPPSYSELSKVDPFGHSIWLWSDKVGTIKDTSPLEAVFTAYRHGTLDDVKTKLALLEGPPAEGVNDSLAFLALRERRADVLRFCLDTKGQRRFPFQAAFVFRNEAERVDAEKDPETFKTLQDAQFWKQYPRRRQYRPKSGERVGAPLGAAAIFDVGGKLPVDW